MRHLLSVLLASAIAFSCTLAPAHEVPAEQCYMYGSAAAFIAQDRNRGLTPEATRLRHLRSIRECMATGDKCEAFQDGEDVSRVLSYVEQIFAIPSTVEVDPREVYSQVTTQCVRDAHKRDVDRLRGLTLPPGVHPSGAQVES